MLQPPTAEYTFFWGEYGLYSRLDDILGYKTNPNKFKRFEIIQTMTFDHSGKKLESIRQGNLVNSKTCDSLEDFQPRWRYK